MGVVDLVSAALAVGGRGRLELEGAVQGALVAIPAGAGRQAFWRLVAASMRLAKRQECWTPVIVLQGLALFWEGLLELLRCDWLLVEEALEAPVLVLVVCS